MTICEISSGTCLIVADGCPGEDEYLCGCQLVSKSELHLLTKVISTDEFPCTPRCGRDSCNMGCREDLCVGNLNSPVGPSYALIKRNEVQFLKQADCALLAEANKFHCTAGQQKVVVDKQTHDLVRKGYCLPSCNTRLSVQGHKVKVQIQSNGVFFSQSKEASSSAIYFLPSVGTSSKSRKSKKAAGSQTDVKSFEKGSIVKNQFSGSGFSDEDADQFGHAISGTEESLLETAEETYEKPSPSPSPTKESPSSSPETTPVKEPPLPEPTGEKSPEPSPEKSPEETPKPSPEKSPEKSPKPSSEKSPEESPEPSPEKSPEPSPTESPLPQPFRAEFPLPQPSPAESPLPQPSPAESPLPEPSPAESPLPEPSPAESPLPQPSPAESPLPQPSPAESPLPQPSSEESPLLEPSPEKSPESAPVKATESPERKTTVGPVAPGSSKLLSGLSSEEDDDDDDDDLSKEAKIGVGIGIPLCFFLLLVILLLLIHKQKQKTVGAAGGAAAAPESHPLIPPTNPEDVPAIVIEGAGPPA